MAVVQQLEMERAEMGAIDEEKSEFAPMCTGVLIRMCGVRKGHCALNCNFSNLVQNGFSLSVTG